jgi:DMSO/TMAO reductase YedYZ molybdopterin-dependent catalytic subunit
MFERLFGNREMDPATAERIPPASTRPTSSPVLHYGSVPRVDLATWDFRVWGEVDNPFTLTWQQFKELPRKTIHTDIHA